jgi:hypothetical protein
MSKIILFFLKFYFRKKTCFKAFLANSHWMGYPD